MFKFIKKVFIAAMSFFGCNVLECVSMNHLECKLRLEIINLIAMNLSFILTVLVKINAMIVVIVSMIHMQKYVFLMLIKT